MRRLWTSWTELLNKSCCFVSSSCCFVLGVGLGWGLDGEGGVWGGVGMLGAEYLGAPKVAKERVGNRTVSWCDGQISFLHWL
jgi:hypothetical protein